jgi:hypothetical protein
MLIVEPARSGPPTFHRIDYGIEFRASALFLAGAGGRGA